MEAVDALLLLCALALIYWLGTVHMEVSETVAQQERERATRSVSEK